MSLKSTCSEYEVNLKKIWNKYEANLLITNKKNEFITTSHTIYQYINLRKCKIIKLKIEW